MRRVRLLIQEAWESPVGLASLLAVILRAACLLTLPMLMVDVVWFGVVEQGVRSAVPGIVRAETLAEYERHMSADEVQLVEASYSAPNLSGVRTFVGEPSQLGTFSPLSRTLARVSTTQKGASITHGIAQVRNEYQAIGIDLKPVQRAFVLRSVRNMASCLVTIALTTCAHNWLLTQKVSSGRWERGLSDRPATRPRCSNRPAVERVASLPKRDFERAARWSA